MEVRNLTPQEKIQRLPTALAQVKAYNTSENLLNEIRQTIYSLYQEKEVTKKEHNNIMISILYKIVIKQNGDYIDEFWN